jgi:hypothetical protein
MGEFLPNKYDAHVSIRQRLQMPSAMIYPSLAFGVTDSYQLRLRCWDAPLRGGWSLRLEQLAIVG